MMCFCQHSYDLLTLYSLYEMADALTYPQQQQMEQEFSPNLFLFQNYIVEVLKECKKHLKGDPFESMEPDCTNVIILALLRNEKHHKMSMYHQYFLLAMGNSKTRQLACKNYDHLIKQNLLDKEHLPPSMVSSVIGAVANLNASSTGSSSMGSANLSNQQNQWQKVAQLIKSIILNTSQPPSELNAGLGYLLEGTHKKNDHFYGPMLLELYTTFLCKFRQPPVARYVHYYTASLLDEVEAFFGDKGHQFASRKHERDGERYGMLTFDFKEGFGKYGRCFICRKEANHYMKEDYTPVCSIQCKEKVKSLTSECESAESFSLMGWITENLHKGDDLLYQILNREISMVVSLQLRSLTFKEIESILKTSIHQLPSQPICKSLLPILANIICNKHNIMKIDEQNVQNHQKLSTIFKVFYLETVRLVELRPIGQQSLEYVYFMMGLLKDEETFMDIFLAFDCNFFQTNMICRFLNVISQYAKRYPRCIEGQEAIVRMLARKLVFGEGFSSQQLTLFHVDQFLKKKELKKIVTIFNKKPNHGIRQLKKIFEIKRQTEEQSKLNLSNLSFQEQENFELSPKKKSSIEEIQKCEEKQGFKADSKEKTQIVQRQQQRILVNEIQMVQKQPIKQKRQQPMKQETSQKINEKIGKVEASIECSITPKEVAAFILQNLEQSSSQYLETKLIQPHALQKTKVGQYFGTKDEYCESVCKQFLQLLPLEGLRIDDILRVVFNLFTLPKQTQQVERILGYMSTRLMGLVELDNEDAIYQYISIMLMVQTSHQNPNVQDKDKIKLEDHLGFCKYVKGGVEPERATRDYKRILESPLEKKMQYREDIFNKKYLMQVGKYRQKLFPDSCPSSLTQLKYLSCESRNLLLHIWDYLLIGLISLDNIRGLYESIILYGRFGLVEEQKMFFESLRKIAENNPQMAGECNGKIFRIALEHGNHLYSSCWDYIIKIIFYLEEDFRENNSSLIDKLFTNSTLLSPQRLKDFLQALLVFSTSQFKTEVNYHRELFVLRHINSILEYNMGRFQLVALHIWPIIVDYFRDICLHPRREVSMAAIDSYKQLTLKLFKLKGIPSKGAEVNKEGKEGKEGKEEDGVGSRQEELSHTSIMQNYLYIFKRSTSELKDLLLNILINVIGADMCGGWQVVYSILEITDCKDKKVIITILERLLNEVGFEKLTQLPKLHEITLNLLKSSSKETSELVISEFLSKVKQICCQINEVQTWQQTLTEIKGIYLKSIKDNFRISINNKLLDSLVEIMNKCLSINQGTVRRHVSIELAELLQFFIDLQSVYKPIQIIPAALEALWGIDLDFMCFFMGISSGMLDYFQLFLFSPNKLLFVIFIKNYLANKVMPFLSQKRQEMGQLIKLIVQWTLKQFEDSLPKDLDGYIQSLSKIDKDFQKGMAQIVSDISRFKQKKEEEGLGNPNQLIQFNLSSKQYRQKSIIHLMMLDLLQCIHSHLDLQDIQLLEEIEKEVIYSYQYAIKINRLMVLRNFLSNNGFLATNAVQNYLPGFHKQEHRSISFAISSFSMKNSFSYIKSYVEQYYTNLSMKESLNTKPELLEKTQQKKSKNKIKSKNNEIKEEKAQEEQENSIKQYKYDLNSWLQHSSSNVCSALQRLSREISSNAITTKQTKILCELCLKLLGLKDLPDQICLQSARALQVLYQKIL